MTEDGFLPQTQQLEGGTRSLGNISTKQRVVNRISELEAHLVKLRRLQALLDRNPEIEEMTTLLRLV